jgi:hypothetical protein
MPTIYFIDFEGDITLAEATEQQDAFTVADGLHVGVYPKLRQNKFGQMGFFLSWGAAREAQIDILDSVIARKERDLELMKKKRQDLDEMEPPGQ